MKIRIAVILCSGLFMWSFVQAGVRAQASADSVLAGVYTEDQAMRGASVYADNCAMCHGEDLSGSDPIPGLMGAAFTGNWKTIGDLFDKTLTSMPAFAPGSLTPEQTADVLAYMLSANHPAGEAELSADAEPLQQIMIEPAP